MDSGADGLECSTEDKTVRRQAPMPLSTLPLGLPATTQITNYRVPSVPVGRQRSSIWQQATLPVSLPLPRFSAPGPELTPAPAQPQPVVTQEYHSPPGSGSSTPLYDLAEFGSSVARVQLHCRQVGTQPHFCGALGYLLWCPRISRLLFTPLNPQGSQVSHLSSVQLSPNRVRSDFDIDTVDLDPLFATWPRCAGDLLLISQISSPESPVSYASPDAPSRPDEASASVDSGRNCPATLSSITNHTGEIQLMTPSLIPLPAMINVQTDPALLLQLTQAYREWLSQPPPVPAADPPPVLSREGPFHASAEPAAIRDHLLISNQRGGCPYHVTSYRDDGHSNLNSPFGMQVHHPRFLEWVGAPESARVLGRPPAEWLQLMSRQDTLHAALQLHCDASLLSSNLAVLHQYTISLHQTLTDVLHSVFGREIVPLGAVNETAPVHFVHRFTWRPPVGPGGPGLDTVHQGPQCPGYPLCCLRPSGW